MPHVSHRLHVHRDILFAYLLEQFFIMSFTSTYQWGENINLLALIIFQNKIENLLFSVLHHSLTRKIRIGYTGTCIKQTQIIINFRCCADCRTGILIRRFCSIEITGLNPVILSTSGRSRFPRKLRAYAEKVSIYRRCPSAKSCRMPTTTCRFRSVP